MIVALDAANFFAGLTNGTPIYLYNLVRALVEEDRELRLRLLYHHRVNTAAREILGELEGERVQIIRSGVRRTGIPRGGWWMPRHPRLERFVRGVDVFHGGDFLRPPTGDTPTVVTIYDLSTMALPEHHVWLNRLRDRWKLEWATSQADRLIAISAATRGDLVEMLGVDPDRVDVVPLARGGVGPIATTDAAVMRRKLGLNSAPFILTVGTIEPRKNHLRLVRSFERLAAQFPEFLLVMAGGKGWKAAELLESVQQSPVRERIRMLGFVDDADLATLYREATIFAYPSLYEGFGLPVLEAMAAESPVVTAAISSTAEVAGDAALLVDPKNEEELTNALRRLLESTALQEEYVRRGRERERTFTWQRTARLTLESYRRARSIVPGGAP